MQGYPYSPLELPSPSIRLLRIAKGSWNNDIRCDLTESTLANSYIVPYKALSYRWEGSKHRLGVPGLFINQREVDVMETLFKALRYIRCEQEDVYLWVDALCINQNDEAEKSSQVNHMGHVYRSAEEVIIWLGESVINIEPLFKLITEVDEKVKQSYRAHSSATWEQLCRRHMTNFQDYPLIPGALEHLLRASWFERVWIIQEVANATLAVIRCGEYTCKARTFACMPSITGVKVTPSAQAVLDIMPRFRANTWWASNRDLHSLLIRFKDSQASNPRDKVYALLGISDDACGPGCFFPDYRKTMSQVVRDTASFLVFSHVLDEKFAFPDFDISDLTEPITEIAKRIIRWILVNGSTNGVDGIACRRTARALMNICTEGHLNYRDLLVSLAEKGGEQSLALRLFVQEDVETEVEPSLRSSSPEASMRPLPLAPFKMDEDMDALIKSLTKTGPLIANNALLRARVWQGDCQIVRALLELGFDLAESDDIGWTPLHIAVARGNTAMVHLLLNSGANINQAGLRG